MRLAAAKIVGVARPQYRRLLADGYLQPALQYQAALLAFVGNGMPARARTRLVTLLDELDGLA